MTPIPPEPQHTPAALGPRLLAHQRDCPGRPCLLSGPGLTIAPAAKAALEQRLDTLDPDQPLVLGALGNSHPAFNPFAGLADADKDALEPAVAESLVALLGAGYLLPCGEWPTHLALISARAVDVLARSDTTTANAMQRLQAAGGRVLLDDTVFVFDDSASLTRQRTLDPHEQRRPGAWGQLTERLRAWLAHAHDEGLARELDAFRAQTLPVTLHITHSWGGGVAQWVNSFIAADDQSLQFQLRSEGPETGAGCGQRYSLYLGNRLDEPVASWWLQPPVKSTVSRSDTYRELLQVVLARYGVGRVLVSSLVGHSLDALRTGLPTVQVLHDFYPAWPLLGVHPRPWLRPGETANLKAALAEHRPIHEFDGVSAETWQRLSTEWRETVRDSAVRIVAPGRSVVDLLQRLDPDWSGIDVAIVPHGLPELPGDAPVEARPREDGRLRIVVPGRMQEGKGQRLLLEALPELTRYAQVYLLGAGKEGEAFFGKSGVNVVLQYRREELRDLLSVIGPHVACLLSIVPETFSYTLSEMQQLRIPVVATRVGSLEERIVDGETGWLVEPEAASLIERVRLLAEDHEALRQARARLAEIHLPDDAAMTARYREICAPVSAPRVLGREQGLVAAQASALAFENMELMSGSARLKQENTRLTAEVETRTRWAQERERARRDEEQRRIRWVSELETELAQREQELADTAAQLQANRESLERETAAHRQTRLQLDHVSAEHEWTLSTRTWRATRPFRVAGRVLANLQRAGILNPLRWPLLISQASRTVRTRGLRGALLRLQLRQGRHKPQKVDTSPLETIGDPSAPERMSPLAKPRVSIVIPVHNKWVYTAACLRSLASTDCRVPYEVIVVDDQSSDETSERLQEVEGLISLRNEENLGFIGSCNRGAERASGEFIVMLNNDTQVMDGWLDALLETFERHPDTGMVGARLVYPDGRLQEAGGIVFRDGSGWNYGKGDVADRPEYQFVRETDYCSGACIMLRTDLFRELGGFDGHFAPAYYEDTDLAFRIRQKSLKVRLQPAATIVHHEGVSSGTDLSSGIKRYQAVNREKFLERWAEALPSYPAPIVNPEDRAEIRRARDHRLKGRVLVIDAYTPEPDQDSGSLRLCFLMQCFMDLGYGVTFLADNRAHTGRYTTDLQQAGVEVVYDPWVDSLQRFFSERGNEFAIVMISRHYVASKYVSLIRRHCPHARFIFDTVDLHYLREERLAELESSLPLRRAAAQTRRSELGVIQAADATLVVSPVEKTVLEKAAPEARVHVISNVHEVVGSRRPFAERKDLFFVGGYQHPPNIDAAIWFVGKIWPLVREQLPDVEFHLIGSKAPDQVRALDGNGVRFHGFVEDLEPWLDNCRLAVAPLRYGAGIKGKVNISMSRGQPVVATPMAVEGMFAQSGRDILVGESAEEFAAAVVRLYSDEALWNRISAAGLENVERYFSVETARLGLQELLRSFD